LRAEGGRGFAQQVVADRHHVDGARAAARQQIRALQRGAVHREAARAGQQHATRAVPPGARERGQAGHGAHRVGAAMHALHAVVQTDGGGLRGAIVARELADLLHRHAAHLRGALWRPLQGTLAQFFPAHGVARDVVVVEPAVGDELVHQRQCQRCIGAGQELDVLVAFFGGFALARVDAHQAWRRPAWPVARCARNAGCCQSSCCPR
jgi:hypothetical protein